MTTPKFTKSDAKAIEAARTIRVTNPGYYAATMAGIQRAGSSATQKSIEALIALDGTAYMFRRLNGCLVDAVSL